MAKAAMSHGLELEPWHMQEERRIASAKERERNSSSQGYPKLWVLGRAPWPKRPRALGSSSMTHEERRDTSAKEREKGEMKS